MRRETDLIRLILAQVELNTNPMRFIEIKAHGYSPNQIAYHVRLLAEAGYVDAVDFTTMDGMDWKPKSLTWIGHDFLDATRNDSIWEKVKTQLKDRGLVDAPLDVVKALAIKTLGATLGLDV
jgi:hypothetical protein